MKYIHNNYKSGDGANIWGYHHPSLHCHHHFNRCRHRQLAVKEPSYLLTPLTSPPFLSWGILLVSWTSWFYFNIFRSGFHKFCWEIESSFLCVEKHCPLCFRFYSSYCAFIPFVPFKSIYHSFYMFLSGSFIFNFLSSSLHSPLTHSNWQIQRSRCL